MTSDPQTQNVPGLRERKYLYWLLCLLAVFVVGLMVFVHLAASRVVAVHGPLLSAAKQIQVETITGHLWFEELLSGERGGDLEQILDYQDEAEWYATAMLTGGVAPEGELHPLPEPVLRLRIEDLKSKLAVLRDRTVERYEAPRTAPERDPVVFGYHEAFHAAVHAAGNVETTLGAILLTQIKTFRLVQRTLIGTTALATLLAAVAFYRFERKGLGILRSLEGTRRRAGESEARFRDLAFCAADWIWETDPSLRYTYCSWRVEEILGYPAQDVLGKTPLDLMPPEEARMRQAVFRRLIEGKDPLVDLENWRLARDGRRVCLLTSGVPILDEQGELKGYRGVDKDITDRKQAETHLLHVRSELARRVRERTAELEAANQELRDEVEGHRRTGEALRYSERKYSTLVENAPTGIFIYRDDRFVFVNRRLADMLGYTPEELLGMSGIPLLHPEDQARVHEIARRRLAGQAAPGNYETRVITKDGATVWLHVNVALIDYRGSPSSLGNAVDITKRKQMEAALEETGRQLRRLSQEILTAQEEERARIARELHDGLGQSLSALKFQLENALRTARECCGASELAGLEPLVARIQDAVEEVRRISMALRPSTLDDLGLLPTVNWFCREFEAAHPGIRVEKGVGVEEGDISETLKTPVFRILQEAMNNVARHSGARTVRVGLRRGEAGLVLRVEDDGAGFDPEVRHEGLQGPGGFGLRSMRERAELSGGAFALASEPGRGTTLTVTWPAEEPAGGSERAPGRSDP